VTGRLAHTVASDSLTTMGYRQRPAAAGTGRRLWQRNVTRTWSTYPGGNTIIGLIAGGRAPRADTKLHRDRACTARGTNMYP
jgi:hypothetical protein